MSPDTRRKCKALVILAMLVVSEGRRVSSRIRLSHSQSDVSALNADGGSEKGVHKGPEQDRLATSPKVMEQAKLAFEHVKAMFEDPDLQEHSMRFASQINAMLTAPKVQEQAGHVSQELKSIMEDLILQENVNRSAKQIIDLATHDKVVLHAKELAEYQTSIMEDQAFSQHGKLAWEQLEAMVEDSGLQQQLKLIVEQVDSAGAAMGYADLQRNAELAVQQLTSIMEDSRVQKHLKVFGEHVNAMVSNPKVRDHDEFVAELLEAIVKDPDVQEQAELVWEQWKAIMQDPLLQKNSELFSERMRAVMTDPKVQQHAKLASEQLKAIMENPTLQDNSESFGALMEAMGEHAEVEKVKASSLLEASRNLIPRLGKFVTRHFIPPHPPSHGRDRYPLRNRAAGTSAPTLPSLGSAPEPALESPGAARLQPLASAQGVRSTLPSMSESEKKKGIDVSLLLVIGLWYLGNFYYNITNKMALNTAAGVPLTIATMQLGVGVLYSLFMWLAPDARKKPDISFKDYVKTLPVSAASAGAHAATTLSLSAGSVSFANIVKASEPAFAAVIGMLAYGVTVSKAKWLSLIPVIGGVALASLGELNFAVSALIAAMGANIFAAVRSNENKKLMSTPGLSERIGSVGNQYAITTINAFLFLLPVALLREGAKLGSFLKLFKASPLLRFNTIAAGLLFYLYNELSTITIEKTNAVTQSVANTAKRVIVIVFVGLAMNEGLSPLKLIGSAIGISGVFLYSIIDKLVEARKAKREAPTEEPPKGSTAAA